MGSFLPTIRPGDPGLQDPISRGLLGGGGGVHALDFHDHDYGRISSPNTDDVR